MADRKFVDMVTYIDSVGLNKSKIPKNKSSKTLLLAIVCPFVYEKLVGIVCS